MQLIFDYTNHVQFRSTVDLLKYSILGMGIYVKVFQTNKEKKTTLPRLART